MTVGLHLGADLELLADVLPRIEPIIIDNLAGEDPGTETEGGDHA
ncbi:hypothetical protein [Sphingomonas sp. BK580]|nr:hypothetical protein [Sphingomonas sp. BK580]MBB3691452.1 hypothetical protein [Sphingomonas sp. BK580]